MCAAVALCVMVSFLLIGMLGPVYGVLLALVFILPFIGIPMEDSRVFREKVFNPASPPKNAQDVVDRAMFKLAEEIREDPGSQDLRKQWSHLSRAARKYGYHVETAYERYFTLKYAFVRG